MAFKDKIRSAWNVFTVQDRNTSQSVYSVDVGPSTHSQPHKIRLRYFNDKSFVSSIYTRIGIDVAAIPIKHILVDENDQYASDADSYLNECLKLEPNLDQAPRAFRQDLVMTLFDKGVAAIIPVDTSDNPNDNDKFDIHTMRVGEIVDWFPRHVRVSVYNEALGRRQDVILKKEFIAIVENPLSAVMNEPNSTLQRLVRKLYLLDAVDEQTSSGKLDIIIQLPYVIKSEARKAQAEKRREEIEMQLKGSQYGIAYTDGTEKITQLNRPAENNLLTQVEYLTKMLYGQLGITEDVMNGTADEKTMINYYNRTVEPILDAIVESMQKAFIGRLGKKTNERIRYFRNPFKLVPIGSLAEIADKFTRNEILSSNEIRSYMGIVPSKDPKADKLINSNMPQQPPAPTEDLPVE